MKKRNTIIVIVIIAILFAGLFGFYLSTSANADNTSNNEATISEASIPSEETLKITEAATLIDRADIDAFVKSAIDEAEEENTLVEKDDTEKIQPQNEETTIKEPKKENKKTEKTKTEEPKEENSPVKEENKPIDTEEEVSLNETEEKTPAKETDYSEYPTAAKIWDYLHNAGYNDYVSAGIIGNMMVECGGHTLALKGTIYDNSGKYYGLCQWSLYYCPNVAGLSVEKQLDYLLNTIGSEFKTFGKLSGYSYSEFLNIQNEQTAALAFAKTYERCSSAGYSKRQQCATKALEYFTK